MKTKVYIASPYERGDKEKNVLRQISTFHALWVHGFSPYCPLLLHYIEQHYSLGYDQCLEYDLEWLESCDCVLRLEGESNGADKEVRRAKELGMKVYYSVSEVIKGMSSVLEH